MEKKIVITIGRELGSGGREIGMELSKKLGIPFYDRELLEKAADASGMSRELFEKNDERPTNSFLYTLAMGGSSYGYGYQMPLMLKVYLAQFETMKKLAEENGGVFIGRCADYVLAEVPDAFHVFVHANMETRIKRTVEKHSISENKAREMCMRNDKDRASYYNYYSNVKWGDARHYDLCINTSKIGVDKAVQMIIDSLEK